MYYQLDFIISFKQSKNLNKDKSYYALGKCSRSKTMWKESAQFLSVLIEAGIKTFLFIKINVHVIVNVKVYELVQKSKVHKNKIEKFF